MTQDEVAEFNGLEEQQVSCLLPLVPADGTEDLQGLLMADNRVEENNEQVATVPTANGGTRRKHHRPWTLREVMTLVEGVARCGGGKWADIKKLAFSTVGYRTAVDLKVTVFCREVRLFSQSFLVAVAVAVSLAR